jgi:hypothetical protein
MSCALLLSACADDDPSAVTFTPVSGPVGTVVMVSGANLSNAQSVTIGGATAIVLSQSTSTLTALVMPGAVSGPVQVTTTTGALTLLRTPPGTFTVTATGVPAAQQGAKLVGTGAVGTAGQGVSVAVSADGTTAVVGGHGDNLGAGAAWVYTRTGGVWTQQAKLVGTGAGGSALQGWSVALSADGATAVVGGPGDNGNAGAAWVYTRTGGVWTQQGAKLIGTGAVGAAQQGWSVALSADGTTAVVGGQSDNALAGAAWVYTRTGGAWTQRGEARGHGGGRRCETR